MAMLATKGTRDAAASSDTASAIHSPLLTFVVINTVAIYRRESHPMRAVAVATRHNKGHRVLGNND